MDTPVIVMQKKESQTIFHTPFDSEFPDILRQNFENKFNICCGYLPDDTITVKCTGSYKKIVTSYKQTWIHAYKGNFELYGKPEYLSFLYDVGLGIKTSSGFGMFNILRHRNN